MIAPVKGLKGTWVLGSHTGLNQQYLVRHYCFVKFLNGWPQLIYIIFICLLIPPLRHLEIFLFVIDKT